MKASLFKCMLIALAICLVLFVILAATNVCSWWMLLVAPLLATTITSIYAIVLFKQTKPDKVCTGDGIAHMEIEADQPWEHEFEVH